MEYCPTASVQPPWQNRFDGLLEYDTLELAGRAPALLPSSADRPAYRKEAGKDLLELATQKEPREMDYPTTKMADSPDSKQSPKQQDRDRGGRFGHQQKSMNDDNNKEVQQISLIKDSISRLHSSILPQLRDQIRMLSEALDPEDLVGDPHSKLEFIMEVQSDLDRTLDQLVPATHIAFSRPRNPRSEQTNDCNLGECKSYRLDCAENCLSPYLRWQFAALCRSAGRLINRLNLSTHTNDGEPDLSPLRNVYSRRHLEPELTLIQTQWGKFQCSINCGPEELLKMTKPNEHQSDSKPRYEPFIKLGESALPLLKLSNLFFNKLSVQAMNVKRLPHFTTMSSYQLYILHDLAIKIGSEVWKLTRALEGAKVHEEPIYGKQLKEAIQTLKPTSKLD
ncbi:hypothetical protein KEM48_001960 [Puccinia striiformis f. sp. tritici PST-130]|nr:hypothetical protein KEM48_001960 [Puccinia striiformis f. sp. tritici PST-130]